MSRPLALVGLLFVALMTLSRASAQDPVPFVVVMHPDTETTSLTLDELELIFTGRIQVWDDGTKIQPVLVKGVAEDAFFEAMGVKGARMEQTWVQLTLQGKGDSPRVVKMSEQAVDIVAETPGAIAVIEEDAVTDAVKVTEVLPGTGSGCRGG